MDAPAAPSPALWSRGAPPSEQLRALVRLAAPAVATSLLQTLVFLADRLCLARYDRDALASMQVQGPLMWSLWGVATGALVATVPLVAQAVGASDWGRARDTARLSLRLSLLIGTGVLVVGTVLLEPALALLGPADVALRGLSRDYLRIALLGFPPLLFATVASFVLTASGDTRTPLVTGALANVANVIANLALVFGFTWGPVHVPALGVRGAAIGSCLAFLLEALLLARLLSGPPRREGARLHVPNLLSTPREQRLAHALWRLGAPTLVERLVMHGGFLLYAAVIARLGGLVMASNQALVTLEAVCFLSADGFAVAAATLTGQGVGDRRPADARRAGWLAALSAGLLLTALGLGLWALGPWLLGYFVPAGGDDEALRHSAASALPLLALSQPFMAVAVVLAQALRGAGDTRSPLVATVLGGLLVRVALAWWLGTTTDLGARALWMATTADWALRAALLAHAFRRARLTPALERPTTA